MKLSDENYYEDEANWKYMSVSQFNDFIRCEARAVAVLNGEIPKEDTRVFLVGNYVHSAFEGEEKHQQFLEENSDKLYTKKGTLYKDFDVAEQMISRTKKEPFFNEIYQGEKEVIVTGNIFDVEWKGKIDCLNVKEGYFVDLKTTADIYKRVWSNKYNGWVSAFEDYGYITQMYIYKELLKKKYRKDFSPRIYAISKQEPPNVQALYIKDTKYAFEKAYIMDRLPRVVAVKNGEEPPMMCGKCDYCRANKQLSGFVEIGDLIN